MLKHPEACRNIDAGMLGSSSTSLTTDTRWCSAPPEAHWKVTTSSPITLTSTRTSKTASTWRGRSVHWRSCSATTSATPSSRREACGARTSQPSAWSPQKVQSRSMACCDTSTPAKTSSARVRWCSLRRRRERLSTQRPCRSELEF